MNLHLIKNTKIYIQTSESVIYANLVSNILFVVYLLSPKVSIKV